MLNKFDEYWNADEINFESVIYLPIPDTTVRLANLQSGDLDMIERLAAPDLTAVEEDSDIEVARATGIGYQAVTINVKTHLGQHKLDPTDSNRVPSSNIPRNQHDRSVIR